MAVVSGQTGAERGPAGSDSRPDSRVVALRPDIALPGEEIVLPAGDAALLPGDAAAQLLCRIEETLAQPNQWLRFPADIENRFEQDNLAQRSRAMLIKGSIALALFDLFLVSDLSMVPDVFRQMLWLRLGVVTPIGLAALLVVARGSSARLTEIAISFLSVLTTLTITYAIASSHHPYASYYHTGIPLIVIFANIVQRARFWYALGTSLLILMLYIGVAVTTHRLPPDILQNYVMVLASTALFTLIANYNLERDERHTWLMNVRERLRLSNLEDANAQLTRLSEVDPLTDLANRRSFERQLKQLWMRYLALRQPLSLMMIDVDHFKLYNDRLGHPAGDQCLKQVAATIRGHVRSASGELAARLGGEEFAVLLPGLTEERAEEVAQRIRTAVQSLRIAHEAVSDDAVVTVSIGIATADGAHLASPQRLLEAADSALYLAKRGGRNRVRLAGPISA
jgi:diguanylate cyclase (GGDEF)-like protein